MIPALQTEVLQDSLSQCHFVHHRPLTCGSYLLEDQDNGVPNLSHPLPSPEHRIPRAAKSAGALSADPGFESFSLTTSGPSQRTSHPPNQWVLSKPIKQPKRQAGHSPPYSAQVKNAWSYTFAPPIRIHDVDRSDLFSQFVQHGDEPRVHSSGTKWADEPPTSPHKYKRGV